MKRVNTRKSKSAAAGEVQGGMDWDGMGRAGDLPDIAEGGADATIRHSTESLPHSVNVEKGLLGSLLSDESPWGEVEGLLSAEEFFIPKHGEIFTAMLAAAKHSGCVDPLTVHAQLDNRGQAEAVGGVEYLLELAESPLSLGDIEAYAALIRESAIRRQLIRAGHDFVKQGSSKDGKLAAELLDEAENRIFQMGNRLESGPGFRPVSDIREDVLQRIQELCDAKGEISGLATGFPQFDHLTSGLQKSDMIVIAARPSMGKTSLALNIAQNVAFGPSKGKVAIFSLEMSAEQLLMRMLASLGRVDLSLLLKGKLQEKHWASINSVVDMLGKASIFVDESSTLDILGMRRRLRQILQRAGGIDLVIIDYLQLLTSGGNRRPNDRFQEITEISRELKSLAREFNLPVVVLSQLNRELERRESKRPRLSDLRDSGAIEQDADLICFIYRDEYYNREESEERGMAELILSKQRNGPTGMVKLSYRQEYTLFEPPAGAHPADFGPSFAGSAEREPIEIGSEMP